MLEGIIRDSISKAEAKQLKKDGYLIANIYGKGVENISCAFKLNDFIRAMKAKTKLALDVKVGSHKLEIVIQDYQRDVISNAIIHVDMLVLQKDVVSKYMIPIKTKGIPKGLKNKAILIMQKKRVKVQAKGKDLPNEYMFDVTDLDLGDFVKVKDLPETKGVKVLDRDDVALMGMVKAK